MPLPDGNYRYALQVVDHDGRQLASHARVLAISTSGPQGEIPVVTQPEHNN